MESRNHKIAAQKKGPQSSSRCSLFDLARSSQRQKGKGTLSHREALRMVTAGPAREPPASHASDSLALILSRSTQAAQA